MTTFLVTGGAGFIGSHIVEHMVRRGDSVKVVDDLSTGREENIAPLLGDITLIKGSVCDDNVLRGAVKGVDVILHLAAIPSVARSVEDPLHTHRVNVDGTLKLLCAAREAGTRRFVFASSSSVYGDLPTLPKHEEMALQPISPYGASKLAAEAYAFSFWKLFGLETVRLRLFNVFGPRQDPTSQYAAAVPLFIAALDRGERPTIFGDGEQSRDFTFVENVVDAFMCAAAVPGVGGRAFNIACGRGVSVLRLVRAIGRLMGKSADVVFADPRAGDIRHSYADITQATGLLGYMPRIGLEKGLKKTICKCSAVESSKNGCCKYP
jgi:nucleoside-diphosphate-sugar epimerase